MRGYADFAPLGHSVRVIRDEEKGVIAWRIKSRNGETDLNLLAPITTKPWGKHIPQLKDVAGPTQEQRDSQLLFNEPKYIRLDDGDRITSGLIIRHLVLPGQVENSKRVLRWIAKELSPSVHVSLMSQYQPTTLVLDRRPCRPE